MSELYYANLPEVRDPHSVATLARVNLTDFEDYLRRVKKQIERTVPLCNWSPDGVYHALSSTEISPSNLSALLEQKGTFELRFVDENNDLVQLPIRYLYTEERVVILDEASKFRRAKLTHYDEDEKPIGYNLNVNPLDKDLIGTDVKLPHYRVELEPVDDSEKGHQDMRMFFDGYTTEVAYPDANLIKKKGIRKAVAERKIAKAKVKQQEFKHRCLHVNKLPLQDQKFALKPNTYVIDRQLSAIRRLKLSPVTEHRPLIRLFENTRNTKWPNSSPNKIEIDEFRFLKDGFSGVESQRKFVQRALATPDFALLEGPPGSGKTAVITEIILQAIERGQRVLLSASTHVAVDNVIERLKHKNNPVRDEIMLVRIGDEKKVSSATAKYTLDNFVETELTALKKALSNKTNLTQWQHTLRDTIDKSAQEADTVIRRLVLNSAQVICGTTIGILQHPEIREMRDESRPIEPAFDMLILDEASKTTFSEFIVPAMHAKKWIIVGDCRQLSPYVDDREIEVNVAASFDRMLAQGIGSQQRWRSRCLQIYNGLRNADRASVFLQVDNDDDRDNVFQQAVEAAQMMLETRGELAVYDLGYFDPEQEDERLDLCCAAVVVGSEDEFKHYERFLPHRHIFCENPHLETLNARNTAVNASDKWSPLTDESWESAITWRMKKEYEKRLFLAQDDGDATTLMSKLEPMFPRKHLLKEDGTDPGADLLNVFRIGFPSVLESLQFGFGRGRKMKSGTKTAITHGLPNHVLNTRHIALEYQHRMHPAISAYPRESVYGGKLLHDAIGMEEKRSGFPDEQRVLWIDVKDGSEAHGKTKMNQREIDAVAAQLKRMQQNLQGLTPSESETWSVAVLTFYVGQERELRKRLRQMTGTARSPFKLGNMSIELCTSDRFQGHEADIVLLSYVRTSSAGFLDSPNRLNVAITRARYQMIHVGRRDFFLNRYIQRKAPVLHGLARGIPQEAVVADIQRKRRHRS
jgi:hypothetical protein